MKPTLTRPLAFIDLETTGVNVGSDKIIEIAILTWHVDGSTTTFNTRIHPGMPIPADSTAIHGIRDIDVKDAPKFKTIGPAIAEALMDCDFAGFNSTKFDIPLLMEEFLRNEIPFDIKDRKFVDVQNIFHKKEQRTLKAAYKFYVNKELENAHNAEADITATAEILEAQLDKYDDLKQADINALHEFSSQFKAADLMGRIVFNKEGHEVFNFGKHKDKKVEDVFLTEASYYTWLMNGDFPLYTKQVITAINDRVIQKKKEQKEQKEQKDKK